MTPFSRLVEALKPGATGRDIAELLDHRAKRTRVLGWKAGRRGPPQWAIDLLVARLTARNARDLAIAAKVKAGPGLKAGARNLAAYRVRKAREG